MAYGTEIQAKLGIDTSSVGTDLAGAKNIFNKWGKEVAEGGEAHGGNFGGKLVKGIEHKISGAHLGAALAGALGINVEKIADKIAETIVHGSKEGWAEAGKIADENAKLIGEKFKDALSPKQAADNLQKELQRAIKEADSIKGEGGAPLNAEQLAAQETAQKKILEIEKELRDLKKEDVKAQKEYDEARKKASVDELSDGKKVEEINKQIVATTDEILKGDLSAAEIAKKKITLLELEKSLRETMKRIGEEDSKLLKEDIEREKKADAESLARAEKKFSLDRQRFSQSKKLEDDQNKVSDRSKLTVGELASLDGKKKEFSLGKSNLDLSIGKDEGLTQEQIAQKKKAQQIQDLESEAESKRLSGDKAGSEEAFNKVGTLREELVASGTTKSTEGDKFGVLAKQIKEDSTQLQKTLTELIKVEKGKFVSQ